MGKHLEQQCIAAASATKCAWLHPCLLASHLDSSPRVQGGDPMDLVAATQGGWSPHRPIPVRVVE